jgi:tRNA pseudouridine38-40 synthase
MNNSNQAAQAKIKQGRIVLGIEYNGSAFKGYQWQGEQTRTVQGVLEQALSNVADGRVKLTCAGRTDAGVHATGQVVHFDPPNERDDKAWLLGGNANLPPDVSINWVRRVDNDFSARFTAYARCYRYILLNRRVRPAIHQHHVAWQREPLDAERMNRAAQHLLGENDFSAFRSAQCQASHAFREMQSIHVFRQAEYVVLDIQANAFLHHMVRNIMGSLLVVGRGEQEESWMLELLNSKNRNLAGVTAPAAGLYLVNVKYPDEYGLPESGWLPSFN